ncbi:MULTISPECIES: aldehyde dehydrogenase [Staphylococcus]|uniref:Aldehyde dehydrogenase n=8 Tax=Staphylococcus aureus TaxID=1280 RepID=A0AAE8PDS2_STAAU|nr:MULTISPECIES: aldehyde dehydrogenase [Staphylococcus]ETO58320.1 aldehyde dehydrogenase [Staphylococcus aureus MUM270]HBQ6644583.1 aldehyde dehydrogenase [Klebsiella pneumoniae]HDH6210526.1 aldehyde dehydrogenase [Staphylococcus aureus LTCF-14-59]HDH6282201.1 aldehyde dehydrogenase [Staphylococcus aureus LTCF-3-23]HDH6493711.1 aldehyde dehydrogenase [Staphylococcus aureus MRSA-Lux-7]HDK8313632.1 aldehyde dehydrogenase [Staphylococcus aureus subsp. aureus ST22]
MNIIEQKFYDSKAFFNTQQTKDISFRKEQLKKLSKAIKSYESDILEALYTDLGKNKVEAYATEIGITLKSIKNARKELKNWTKTKNVDTPLYLFPTKSYIKKEPYGTVLIIAPFNYPFQLVFEPLIGAIAAGNTAIIKPSELTPNVARVIKRLINETFDANYIEVIEGGIEETQTLIHLPFDYVFFTGSENVGKIVYQAASENLVPVTLEMGGKSPVIVDETANIKVASERICFGKFTNAGQTCVAPDYILVHESVKDDLITALSKTLREFYGQNIQQSPDYGRIVNLKHYHRLTSLLNSEQMNIVFGGHSDEDERYIEPTLLDHVTSDSAIMQEEIFGPILPILTYQSLDEAIAFIHQRPKPLSLYLFSEDENATQRVINELSFGGGAINDTLMHLANPKLPFGGVGASGMGRYHGKYSFDTFTHEKSYIFKSTRLESGVHLPPYKGKFKYIKAFFKN